MLLSRYLRKRNTIPEAPPDRAHPLEAVPIRKDTVEERVSPGGDLHLHATVPPVGLLERIMGRIAKTDKNIQIALDEKGAFFWSQIDGHRDLFTIRRNLRNKYQLSAAESKEATILFVKALMRRGLIRLKVHPKRNP